jgi:predicted aconitase
MHLTKEEENVLAGGQGEVAARSMRLLVKLGDIYGAAKMIPIGSAQVAGVSYKSIGDPGRDFLEDYARQGAKVKVPTFLNPAGMDIEDWEELKFPKEFAYQQMRIMEAFRRMGIIMSASCTPYLAGNLPRYGEHIAWSESSAVSFSNSVIGARTNREGGPSALAAAICGVTPDYGYHRDENRHPHFHVKVSARLEYSSDYGALGWFVGKVVKDKIPYFTGLSETAGTDELKALGAAMAASGAVAMYHAEALTPEARFAKKENLQVIDFSDKELNDTYAKLSPAKVPDIVVIGCPHASMKEIARVAQLVEGKHLKKPLWVCTSRVMKEAARRMGYAEIIEKAGGKIVADTCMVVAPIEDMGFKTTGVNSGKAASYLPGHCKQNVMYGRVEDLVEAASK